MQRAEFEWQATADHPAFAGHFPGRPILPGVVLLDQALLFAAAMLPFAPAAWQIGSCKFFRPVGPGDVLIFELTARGENAFVFAIRCGDHQVATGSGQAER